MIDAHTHLYWESYDRDRDEVLERARETGVSRFLVVGTTIEESYKAIALAEQYEDIFSSVGIHPNELRDGGQIAEDWEQELGRLTQHPKVVAIGECGLDYSESHGPITEAEKERQKKAFEKQIALAEKVEKSLIVHCRATSATSDDAYRDLLEILIEQGVNIGNIILHCYMGSASVTEHFLSLPNVYFSFTGNITYPTKATLRGGVFDLAEVVKMIPLDRILSETDCPFLAPQSKRGTRNEPAFVREVVERIAELQGVSLEIVDKQIVETAEQIFCFDEA